MLRILSGRRFEFYRLIHYKKRTKKKDYWKNNMTCTSHCYVIIVDIFSRWHFIRESDRIHSDRLEKRERERVKESEHYKFFINKYLFWSEIFEVRKFVVISQFTLYIHSFYIDRVHLWSAWDKCVQRKKKRRQTKTSTIIHTHTLYTRTQNTKKNDKKPYTFVEIVRMHAVSACWTPSLIVHRGT